MKRLDVAKGWFGETDLSDLQQVRLALWLTGLDQSVAYWEQVVVDAVAINRREDGWALRVSGRRYAGVDATEYVVAWQEGASFYDCLDLFASAIRRREVRWREDKYPKFDGLRKTG